MSSEYTGPVTPLQLQFAAFLKRVSVEVNFRSVSIELKMHQPELPL
jgi:hypothetical protein